MTKKTATSNIVVLTGWTLVELDIGCDQAAGSVSTVATQRRCCHKGRPYPADLGYHNSTAHGVEFEVYLL